MNSRTAVIENNRSNAGNIVSWFFGIVFMVIGLINVFWGNDTLFGVFLVLLSFVFFPPVNALIKRIFGFTIPVILKIILAIFIIWASVGVGELFDKIELMMGDL